jgi:hypothetical protein
LVEVVVESLGYNCIACNAKARESKRERARERERESKRERAREEKSNAIDDVVVDGEGCIERQIDSKRVETMLCIEQQEIQRCERHAWRVDTLILIITIILVCF